MARLCEGKIAIVTGAGRGIGREHALSLAAQGAKVVVNDLGGNVDGSGGDLSPAEQVVQEIKSMGGEAVANGDSVSDWAGAERLINTAIETFGDLNIVVNNAGILRDRMVFSMSEAEWDAVINVHLKGTFAPTRFACVYWREQSKAGKPVSGRIINTTSGAGLGGTFGQTNYATAKAAIAGLTLTLAQELAAIGTTVNCIGPAGLTRITATMPGAGEAFEPDDIADDDFHPMDPGNSSPLVAWLASDQAAYVNGQVIRALYDKIIWMQGWRERITIDNNNKKWDATKLGGRFASEVFQIAPTGINFLQA